jgi:hypothetical protein
MGLPAVGDRVVFIDQMTPHPERVIRQNSIACRAMNASDVNVIEVRER